MTIGLNKKGFLLLKGSFVLANCSRAKGLKHIDFVLVKSLSNIALWPNGHRAQLESSLMDVEVSFLFI